MNQSGVARTDCGQRDLRTLILTPQGRDASLAEQTLAPSGLCPHVCADLEQLRQEAADGAGAVLIAEEALPQGDTATGGGWIGPEPPWSSLPLIVLLGRSASPLNATMLRRLENRPNVTFLQRPVPKRTLVSTVRASVEARRLQYAIRDALDALQTANRRKDEFLATLAHELRNPLAPIRSAVYVLQKSNGDDPASKNRMSSLVSMVERQVDHLVRLVDDLLEVSRITTGKVVLKRQPVRLAEVISQAVEISEPLIRSGQHALSVSLSDKPLVVDGDPVRLAQVFANLLNNAAKYTPQAGSIEISLAHDREQATVSVRDNGIGITQEMLPRVFDLFTQSNRSRDRDQGGLGVGLALVRSLVEMHGGQVEAYSDGASQGSEFVIRLPLVAAPGDAAEVKPAVLTAPALHRVMVVDDDKDVANSFAALLQSLGADVHVTHSGLAALSSVANFKPHVAFVDIGMPELDGYEVARRLRSTSHGRDLVLVALSGWGRDEDRQRAFEAGFNYHTVKPISLDALEKVLASVPFDQ